MSRASLSLFSLKMVVGASEPRAKSLSSLKVKVSSAVEPLSVRNRQKSIECQSKVKDFVSNKAEIASERKIEDFSFEKQGVLEKENKAEDFSFQKTVENKENIEKVGNVEGIQEKTKVEELGMQESERAEKIEKKAVAGGENKKIKVFSATQKTFKVSCREKIEEIKKNKENGVKSIKMTFQKNNSCCECLKEIRNEEKGNVVTLSCTHKIHKVKDFLIISIFIKR